MSIKKKKNLNPKNSEDLKYLLSLTLLPKMNNKHDSSLKNNIKIEKEIKNS